MTTITIELPEQLATDIEPLREELPVLLAITKQLFRPASDGNAHTSAIYRAYKQFFDFLAAAPSPERILRFMISPQAQVRVQLLLDKHGEDELSPEEQAELRVYAQINEIINLKKAEAAFALAQSA
ncbi:MAG: hypothetical protein ACOYNY_06040 [Caldilineaceae bacterium]|jgi:hypothetical protein